MAVLFLNDLQEYHLMPDSSLSAQESKALVARFLEAWEHRDLPTILSCFCEDAVYHNVPVAPIEGIDGIRAVFEGFLDVFDRVELEPVRMAAEPDLVFSERIDHFRLKDGTTFDLPVNGVFELTDGKIRRFSDYFDLHTFESGSGVKL